MHLAVRQAASNMGLCMASGDFLLIFVCAFALGTGATPVMRNIALRLGLIDYPTARKVHTAPVPLLGGVAIYVAVVIALLLYNDRKEIVQVVGILLSATWISLCGMWDDRKGLPVSIKLLVQVAAALILFMSGVQVHLPVPGWLNVALTLFWVLAITNAFNLLDNIDGLCGGIGAVAAAYFLLLASLNGQYLVGAFAAALLGACLGFLIYNFNPARIFMGDVGSLFIGFLIAALGIKLRFPGNIPQVTWMIPILVLGVPIFDTTLVVVSRLRGGNNPLTTPGTDHVSHRLVRLGWTPREAVLLLYLAGCMLGGMALFVSVATARTAYTVALLAALAAVVTMLWLEYRTPPVRR
jgi:UDP-GlcNAc:undecaprenyl-phosphate GlcNAc-1-phosphate transferase